MILFSIYRGFVTSKKLRYNIKNLKESDKFMAERLTREQMAEKYPNTYLGINNIKYQNDDGVTLESADVVYTDKTSNELLKMQISGTNDIIAWYTNDNGLPSGVAGVL